MVNAKEYAIQSKAFEKSLDDEYRKNHGVFYTDISLSGMVVDYLGIKDGQSIFDPCCGAGSFLYSALVRGYKNVYGADLHADAVKICKDLTGLDSSVREFDTLKESGSDTLDAVGLNGAADYIVGNPPYCPIETGVTVETKDKAFLERVKRTGNNLFVAALYRAFELAKDDGVIAYIVPKNFLHVRNYSLLRKFILLEKTILSVIDIGAYFPNVRGEQVIFTLKNKRVQDFESHQIRILKLVENSFQELCAVSQNSYKDEILLFKSAEEYAIYRRLEENYLKLADIRSGYIGRGKSKSPGAVIGREIRKFGFKNRSAPVHGNKILIQNIYSAEAGIMATVADDKTEAAETVTVIAENDENLCRYLIGVLHSRLCNFYLLRFCYNGSKLTAHTDAKYLDKLPVKIPTNKDDVNFHRVIDIVKSLEAAEYMSGAWFRLFERLNKQVYEIYEFNAFESAYVDEEMKLAQSRKWTVSHV